MANFRVAPPWFIAPAFAAAAFWRHRRQMSVPVFFLGTCAAAPNGEVPRLPRHCRTRTVAQQQPLLWLVPKHGRWLGMCIPIVAFAVRTVWRQGLPACQGSYCFSAPRTCQSTGCRSKNLCPRVARHSPPSFLHAGGKRGGRAALDEDICRERRLNGMAPAFWETLARLARAARCPPDPARVFLEGR